MNMNAFLQNYVKLRFFFSLYFKIWFLHVFFLQKSCIFPWCLHVVFWQHKMQCWESHFVQKESLTWFRFPDWEQIVFCLTILTCILTLKYLEKWIYILSKIPKNEYRYVFLTQWSLNMGRGSRLEPHISVQTKSVYSPPLRFWSTTLTLDVLWTSSALICLACQTNAPHLLLLLPLGGAHHYENYRSRLCL